MSDRSISNYRLVRRLGVGGMGAVYLGEHHVIDKKVAIKLLLPELCGDDELIGRFFNEARAAATARHPGIVEILDVGYHEDQAFITMEYIEGPTLAKFVRERSRLSEQQALSLTHQIAGALGAAHERGIVHRDLKPNNVMVVTDPVHGRLQTKVFDFGIAKLFGENSSGTRTGVVIGTPLYMSPEQCRGSAEVDHRSDLYSLGCLLYFMLTGKRVFEQADGDGDVIAHHIMVEPASPSDYAPVSPSVCSLTLKLLAKKPEDRFQTTGQLLYALETELGKSIGPDSAVRDRLGPNPLSTPVALPPHVNTPHSYHSTSSSRQATPISPLPVSAVPAPPFYGTPSNQHATNHQATPTPPSPVPAWSPYGENTPQMPVSQESQASASQPITPTPSTPATPMSVSNFINPEKMSTSKLRWAVPALCVFAIALVVVITRNSDSGVQPNVRPAKAAPADEVLPDTPSPSFTATEAVLSDRGSETAELEEDAPIVKPLVVEEAVKLQDEDSGKDNEALQDSTATDPAAKADKVQSDEKKRKKSEKSSSKPKRVRDEDATKPKTLNPFGDD